MTDFHDYDSEKAFLEAIKSLDALNAIIRKRRIAATIRREILKKWVILGRFFFDDLGKVYKFNSHGIPSEIFPNFPNVIEYGDYLQYLKKYLLPSNFVPFTNPRTANIPTADLICPECNKRWTIENCHDVSYDPSGLRHHSCYRQFLTRVELTYFETVFAEAGFKNVEYFEAENPYSSQESREPWFDVSADGLNLTIGRWHDRLTIIICNNPRIDFTKICFDCDVTKGVDYIHAWGHEMSIVILTLMRKIILPD